MALADQNDKGVRMRLNPEKSAFGRHETFPLRYGWLTKGYQAVKKDPKIFESDEATVELGVGKNMVVAIRYWMRACGMMDPQSTELTPLAHFLFDEEKGADPYLEDEGTIWLLHWKLATNAELATTWFWYFNQFHKPHFTGHELQTALRDFVKANIKAKAAASTLKADSAVLTRMYCQSTGNTRTPLEEALDSPLALLGLMAQSPGGRSYHSRQEPRDDLPLEIFGFAIAETMQARQVKTLPVEELMYSRDLVVAPGAIFRLTENALISKLEQLVDLNSDHFAINETAGIHQLYLSTEFETLDFLRYYYRNYLQRDIAA